MNEDDFKWGDLNMAITLNKQHLPLYCVPLLISVQLQVSAPRSEMIFLGSRARTDI